MKNFDKTLSNNNFLNMFTLEFSLVNPSGSIPARPPEKQMHLLCTN